MHLSPLMSSQILGAATNSPAHDLVDDRNVSVRASWTTIPATGVPFSAFSAAADTGTAAAHGLITGTVGQMTTTGALPTGLAVSTNYFIIVVDANTVKFATTLANAQAGTAIDLTTAGTGTSTFTPATAAISATAKLYASIDGANWEHVDSANDQTCTASGSYMWDEPNKGWRFVRVQFGYTSGQAAVSVVAHSK